MIELLRARSAAAKENRRGQLLKAARRMLIERGFDGFTMSDLAKGAGLAKGTAYLYFATKEALLLTVLQEDLQTFFERLWNGLSQDCHGDPLSNAARLISRSLQGVEGLLPLLMLVHTRLERNASEQALKDFKVFLLDRLTRSGTMLETFAGLAPGTGLLALLRAHALAIGIAQMTDHTPLLSRILRETPGLSVMAFEFGEAFETALIDQLRALAMAPTPASVPSPLKE